MNLLCILLLIELWLMVGIYRNDHVIAKLKQIKHKKGIRRLRPLVVPYSTYYRLYKYLYVQSISGFRVEESLKSLYRICNHRGMKKVLRTMSAFIASEGDVERSIDYLREQLEENTGALFITVVEGMAHRGMNPQSLQRMDQLLFQKHLISMRDQVKKQKRNYFKAVLCFTVAVGGMIILPMIEQMFASLSYIFSSR